MPVEAGVDVFRSLTDDGKSRKFIFDGFNRLVKVTDRAGSPRTLAEYRYNGLGWRIGHHDDSDVDNDVDSNDAWYFHVYDLKWRELNAYRVAAGTIDAANLAKERYLYHNAGLGGSGSSSYIDLVIYRDRDDNSTWNSAGDGTLERRDYYCQNWHADVSALVTDTGKMVEWGHPTGGPGGYGNAFGLPGTDMDSDGDVDMTDTGGYASWIGATTYRTRGDWDLDNDVDSADSAECTARLGTILGFGNLSSVKNTRTVAGYMEDRVLPVIHQRHRVLHEELGRWVQRDPMGYVEGTNLYGYGINAPFVTVDSAGLQICSFGQPCGGGSPVMSATGPYGFESTVSIGYTSLTCELPCTANEHSLWESRKSKVAQLLTYWLAWLGAEYTCQEELMCMIRAISWIESCHGTSTGGNGTGIKDPMQIGNPADIGWKTIVGGEHANPIHRKSPKKDMPWPAIPGGNPNGSEPSAYMPPKPEQWAWEVTPIGRPPKPADGHNDPHFDSDTSYYWGILWYFYSIQSKTGKPIYKIPDCDPHKLFDGAAFYNGSGEGAGDPDYACKLAKALDLAGCGHMIPK